MGDTHYRTPADVEPLSPEEQAERDARPREWPGDLASFVAHLDAHPPRPGPGVSLNGKSVRPDGSLGMATAGVFPSPAAWYARQVATVTAARFGRELTADELRQIAKRQDELAEAFRELAYERNLGVGGRGYVQAKLEAMVGTPSPAAPAASERRTFEPWGEVQPAPGGPLIIP